jgi:hypothetical protein
MTNLWESATVISKVIVFEFNVSLFKTVNAFALKINFCPLIGVKNPELNNNVLKLYDKVLTDVVIPISLATSIPLIVNINPAALPAILLERV